MSAFDIEARAALRDIARGVTFSNRSLGSLTTAQAAGTDPILAANSNRRSLIVKTTKQCSFSFHTGESEGMIDGPAFERSGPACPRNALYVHGLSAGDTIRIEEGE